MKIAVLQFNPQVGRFPENIAVAESVIERSSLREGDLEWLILPEMAFSGYNFPSLEAIRSYLEPSASGPSTEWAKRTALRLHCNVSVGYPEVGTQSSTSEALSRGYNSFVTVSPDGVVLANYRKTFLYYTDETWALKGEGFFQGSLPGIGRVTMGICMDINNEDFNPATLYDFDFAASIVDHESPLAVLSMAFTSSLTPEELSLEPSEPEAHLLNYWIERMLPLIINREKRFVVVFANRWGQEGDTCYGGTSTIVEFHNGAVGTFGVLGKAEDGLLVVDTEDQTKGQTLFRLADRLRPDV